MCNSTEVPLAFLYLCNVQHSCHISNTTKPNANLQRNVTVSVRNIARQLNYMTVYIYIYINHTLEKYGATSHTILGARETSVIITNTTSGMRKSMHD